MSISLFPNPCEVVLSMTANTETVRFFFSKNVKVFSLSGEKEKDGLLVTAARKRERHEISRQRQIYLHFAYLQLAPFPRQYIGIILIKDKHPLQQTHLPSPAVPVCTLLLMHQPSVCCCRCNRCKSLLASPRA